MKINQYCSVCKKHLDMDLVPTDDGGDDGVIWLRCPECRGFLPKFSGDSKYTSAGKDAGAIVETGAVPSDPAPVRARGATAGAAAFDVDADDADAADDEGDDAAAVDEDDADDEAAERPTAVADHEPIAEYAAALAAADLAVTRPYRSSGDYLVGEVIHHLAWDDCGLVIAKEALPGNRRAIKVYFASVGVVHLIEQSQDAF